MSKSIMQGEKKCYFAGCKGILHKHHVYGGANRKNSEKYGCWVWLTPALHNMSDEGVHFNREQDLRLKEECQKRFEELYGHEKFMQVFGRNYL